MSKKILLILLVILSITNVQAKTYTKKECKQYAHNLVIKKYHWKESDYKNLVKLWNKESGWRAKARNGIYYGIPQTNKKKYGKKYNDYKTQIKVGLKYIKGRYGNPTKAWQHWKRKHWY